VRERDPSLPVVRSVNSAFAETFGYRRDGAVGESLNDVVVPRGKEEAASLGERFRSADRLEAEVERETADGSWGFRFRNVAVDEDRGADGLAVYVDISEQRS